MASAYGTCRSCQRRVLDTFTSLAGLSLGPLRSSATRAHLGRRTIPHTRAAATRPLHTSIPRIELQEQEQQVRTTATDSPSGQDTVPPVEQQTSTPTSEASGNTDGSIPWYLRVDTPKPLATSLAPNLAAQEIPPLPEDPPSILNPILHHLSITIGLDNLSILDLRDLSPPSALGANLIMILGTARSQKHLNTSADRFCRWLRSTYKLRPYADGLIGRNELKLKLRRKNKKIKLAQSVGNTMYDSTKGYDDGMTTGWICCNLGAVDGVEVADTHADNTIEDSTLSEQATEDNVEAEVHLTYSQKDQERILEDEDPEYKNPSDQDFTYRGFGSASTAPRIVVQMFVEEKRLEMDLEGLWETRIKRRDEKADRRELRLARNRDVFETELIESEIERPEAREGLRESRVMRSLADS